MVQGGTLAYYIALWHVDVCKGLQLLFGMFEAINCDLSLRAFSFKLPGIVSSCAIATTWQRLLAGSRLQPLRSDPDNPPEGTNAITQARTPQAILAILLDDPGRRTSIAISFDLGILLSGSRVPESCENLALPKPHGLILNS